MKRNGTNLWAGAARDAGYGGIGKGICRIKTAVNDMGE